MNYDPKRRDANWQMEQPGCYIDPAGRAHIFPDEILAFLQIMHPQAGFDPNSKADYDLVVKVFSEKMRAIRPGIEIRIIEHTRHAN